VETVEKNSPPTAEGKTPETVESENKKPEVSAEASSPSEPTPSTTTTNETTENKKKGCTIL